MATFTTLRAGFNFSETHLATPSFDPFLRSRYRNHDIDAIAQRLPHTGTTSLVCRANSLEDADTRLQEQAGTTSPVIETTRRNVVIAVDASEDSIAAFQWALSNLYRPGDAMHILHVVPEVHNSPASGSLYYPRYNPLETETSLVSQAEEFIREEFVSVAKEQHNVDVKVVLVRETRPRHIGRAVCNTAEELEASPLVLFAHHKGRLEEFLLGSVSKFCAANCSRPVVLVHPEKKKT